mmetsp:Transcript_7943/g.23936  ORF Transcript_7943/g.23936 Transcript_7943/m.23936 type:complete len:372 (+) Transcript_7943:132-1247(+)
MLRYFGVRVKSDEVSWIDATQLAPVILTTICVNEGGRDGERIVLELRDKEQRNSAIIGVLKPGQQDNLRLNLTVNQEFGVALKTKTNADIHISGYRYELNFDDNSSDGEERDDDEKDEEAGHDNSQASDSEEDAEEVGVEEDDSSAASGDDSEGPGEDDKDDKLKDSTSKKGRRSKEVSLPDSAKERGKMSEPVTQTADRAAKVDIADDQTQVEDPKQAPSQEKHGQPKEPSKDRGTDRKRKAEGVLEADAEGDKRMRPGQVRTLPFGLKIQEILVGNGAAAKPGHHVSCFYTLRLENGKKVDSSGKRPFKFRLGIGEVIKGWDLGLKGMKVGGERHIIVPPKLGYGSKGAPPAIPGNATLLFDVKLVDAQ